MYKEHKHRLKRGTVNASEVEVEVDVEAANLNPESIKVRMQTIFRKEASNENLR